MLSRVCGFPAVRYLPATNAAAWSSFRSHLTGAGDDLKSSEFFTFRFPLRARNLGILTDLKGFHGLQLLDSDGDWEWL